MEELPEVLLNEIFKRIISTSDRNSVSLVSKHLCSVESLQRWSLKLGCGLHPAAEALTSLCNRFPNLQTLEIDYSGWMYRFGNQLDDHGLLLLSAGCPILSHLTLSFCTFVTDTGVGYLSRCSNLSSIELNFLPAVGSNGLLSLTFGCKRLRKLHISRCTKVNSAEWLELLGGFGRLDDLSIKNCRAIGEGDLMKLGSGWTTLKLLEFELDANYRDSKSYAHSSGYVWREQRFPCERLEKLHLTNCFTVPSRGFSCLMGRCRRLERLKLDMCVGLKDDDFISLARNSGNLRAISLRLPSSYVLHSTAADEPPPSLTDGSLMALARGCPFLEEVTISFPHGEFISPRCFTQAGIVALVHSCPIRSLVLDRVHFFNNRGMEVLCCATLLESLEIAQCQELTDEGLRLVRHYPCLTKLSLIKCLGVSDEGLKPLVGLKKLEHLRVKDCPRVSKGGVTGAATCVSYGQDPSWLF